MSAAIRNSGGPRIESPDGQRDSGPPGFQPRPADAASSLWHLFPPILSVLLFAATLVVSSTLPAAADVAQYIDSLGKTHFVDDPAKVPEEYRSQLHSQKPLRAISRSDSAGKPLYEKDRYSSGGANVEIFVTGWCPYCQKLEKLLQSEHISYIRYDIERNAKGKKIYDSLQVVGVPVTRVGSTVIAGYQPEAILLAARRPAGNTAHRVEIEYAPTR